MKNNFILFFFLSFSSWAQLSSPNECQVTLNPDIPCNINDVRRELGDRNILDVTLRNASQGGWVSSGGELFKDAHNPWFVRNTKEVFYCIEVDASSFSAKLDTIENQVQLALSYWQDEFERNFDDSKVQVGTQQFIQKKCTDAGVDLRLVFGRGALKDTEISYLKKTEKYIGVSVRTEYDLINLKGKGFIYISSDYGPYAYENPGPLIKEAWQFPKLLLFALIHEFGHLFGIPHTGSGLMSEVFLDQLLNKFLVEHFLKLPIDSFFSPKNELENCFIQTKIKTQVFKMTPDESCLIVKKSNQGYQLLAKTESGLPRSIGKMVGIIPQMFDNRSAPAIVLQLPKEQKVFTEIESQFRSFMYGPVVLESGFQANLIIDGTPSLVLPLYLKINGSSFSMIGTMDNKLVPYVVFDSFINILLLRDPTP